MISHDSTTPTPETIEPPARSTLRRELAHILGLFVGSKALIGLIALLAPLFFAPGNFFTGRATDVGLDIYVSRWDAGWYATIARDGYTFDSEKGGSVAFFPLFPLLLRGFMAVGFSVGAAGLFIANSCFLGALWLFYRLVLEEFDREPLARHATALFAFCPGVAWFSIGYTEGLFLLLTTGLFLSARRGSLWSVLALGFLAGLARPNAILLPVPLLVCLYPAIRSAWTTRKTRQLTALAVSASGPFLGHAAYLAYLHAKFGTWKASQIAQLKGWDAAVTVNWDVIWQKLPTFGLQLFDRPEVFREHVSWSWLITLFVTAFALIALWESRACLWHAALLVVFMTLYIFILQLGGPVYSIGRFAAQMFPLYLALALFAENRPWARPVTLAACTSLATVTTLMLFAGYHIN